jgi:hypothetical protein
VSPQYFIVYKFTRIVAPQASIYGMPFEKWGDRGTTYMVVYVVSGDVKDNPISAPEARLASKAQMPRFRRAGTFWVSALSTFHRNLTAMLDLCLLVAFWL